MTIFSGELDTSVAAQRSVYDYKVGYGEMAGAVAGETFGSLARDIGGISEMAEAEHEGMELTPGPATPAQDEFNARRGLGAGRGLTYRQARPVPEVTRDEAVARVKDMGLDKILTIPDQPTIKQGALDIMLARAQHRAEYETALARGPQGIAADALRMGTTLAVGAVDPTNWALALLPVVPEARVAAMMSSAGTSILSRAAVRAGIGGVQGGAFAAATIPITAWARTQEGQDYSLNMALDEILQGAATFGLLHVGAGGASDVARALRGRRLYPFGEGEPFAPRPEAVAEVAPPDRDIGGLYVPPHMTDDIASDLYAGGETFPGEHQDSTLAGDVAADLYAPVEPTARAIADLPPEVQRDNMRIAIAQVLKGDPVAVGEVMDDLARRNPRVAESWDLARHGDYFDVLEGRGEDAGTRTLAQMPDTLAKIEAHDEARKGLDPFYRREPFEAAPRDESAIEGIVVDALRAADGDRAAAAISLRARAMAEPSSARGGLLMQAARTLEQAGGIELRGIGFAEEGARYPLAPRSEWHGEANYEQTGGRMVTMTPDEFLAQSRPLTIDETSRENIDLLKQHIRDGKTLDPLQLYANGREDGRHRAIAARELGIRELPVITFRPRLPGFFERERAPAVDLVDLAGGERGEQAVLPGAERIGQGDLAQRRADAPLRARVAQRAADEGLFGGPDTQGSLFEQGRDFHAPPFYSQVERAVTSARQERASPEQWLATIRNTAGVKAEEMDWLGLADWLKGQRGPVNKQQIAEYVRANSVQVRGIQKGVNQNETQRLSDIHLQALAEARESSDKFHDADRDGLHSKAQLTQMAEETEALWNRAHELGRELDEATKFGSTKFAGYQLPGGENYRELLLTLPEEGDRGAGAALEKYQAEQIARYGSLTDFWRQAPEAEQQRWYNLSAEAARVRDAHGQQPFRTSHWDEPNVLAHIRFNDRVIDGKRTLFIEEVQSDWHQKGRRIGYAEEGPTQLPEGYTVEPTYLNGVKRYRVVGPQGYTAPSGYGDTPEMAIRATLRTLNADRVPDAPFKTTWPELSLKRMIRYAAEHGYEQVAWTPGKVQAERYDLSKQVNALHISRDVVNGNFHIEATTTNERRTDIAHNVEPGKLEDYVGKDLAKKIVDDFGERKTAPQTYSGLDLKVGGEGMSAFYDKMLPAAANKLVKKFGAKVGESHLEHEGGIGQWRYEGPSLTPPQIIEAARTSEYGTVQVGRQLNDIAAQVARGMSMAEAVEKFGSWHAAKALGGELINKTQAVPVHTLPITDALRQAAVGEGFALFERGQEKVYPYVDLGPFEHDATAPLGPQAQNYVVLRGLLTGNEHLVALDETGQVVGHGHGGPGNVGLPKPLEAALWERRNKIVVHHNHPNGNSLSRVDVAMLAAPGLRSIWAHGHDGAVAHAQLAPSARGHLAGMGVREGYTVLLDVANTANTDIYKVLQQAVYDRKITVAEAQAAHADLQNKALARADIIEYRSNFDPAGTVAKAGLESHIQATADKVARSFYDDPNRRAIAADDRRAEPLREPGDLGTSFERARTLAGGNARPGVAAAPRARDDRTQGRPGEQLRLPGIAEDQSHYRDLTFRDYFQRLSDALGSPQAAGRALADAGVDGAGWHSFTHNGEQHAYVRLGNLIALMGRERAGVVSRQTTGSEQAAAPSPPSPASAGEGVRAAEQAAEQGPEPAAVHVARRSAFGPRARDPRTWSLFEFLAERGGLRPTPDLQHILGRNPTVFGLGKLLRPGGMTLDHAREVAVGAGYLHDAAEQHGGVTESTINHLLDAIDRESRGDRVYRPGEERETRETRRERLDEIEREAHGALSDLGIDLAKEPVKFQRRVLEIMDREGVHDAHAAYERALMEEDRNAVDRGENPPRQSIPGWDVHDDAGAAPRAGGRGQGPGARADAPADRGRDRAAAEQRGSTAAQQQEYDRLTRARPADLEPAAVARSRAAAVEKEPGSIDTEQAAPPSPPSPASGGGVERASRMTKAALEAEAAEQGNYEAAARAGYLTPEEIKTVDDALALIDMDAADAAMLAERGAQCLMAAVG